MNAALLDWHDGGAWVLISLNAVAGVWAVVANWVRSVRGRALWLVVIAAQLSAFYQAITGAVIMTRDDVEPRELHALYGFSALVAVGILYSYRGAPWMKGKEYLLYGLGCLFIMGLGLRELALS